jgi:hypothetical protein
MLGFGTQASAQEIGGGHRVPWALIEEGPDPRW